eukprot:6212182-Pleurochrysis_carterae.AAC.3
MHVGCGRGDIAVRELRQLLMSARGWRQGGDDAVDEHRGRGQRGRLTPHSRHWRGEASKLPSRAKEVKRNCTEGGGGRRRRRRGRRLQRVRFAQRIRDGSKPPRGPWILFGSTLEGEQVVDEGSMLGCEKAGEGSIIGWRVETLRRPRLHAGSHGVSSAKDAAYMEPRLRAEKGRHCMQVLKRTLRRIVRCFVVRQVESRSERVRLEHHTRKVTKGVVKGCNRGNNRDEFMRGDSVGTTRGSREGEGEEEAVAVAPEAHILSLLICFCSIHRDKQRRHVAQIAQRGRMRRGNGQQQRAAVV